MYLLRSFMRRVAASTALLAVAAGSALAYPGAGPGPSTWVPPRDRPALSATVPMAPPQAVMQLLQEAGIAPASLGLYMRRVDQKAPFAAFNAEQPFVLASTAKVVTALAALDLLGPSHQWRTYAYAKGELAEGRLRGDLLIVGGGNALLSSEALQRWFESLHTLGLREIEGDIVLDRFAFALTPADHARTPLPEPWRPHHALPDAFSLDEGLLRVDVSPLVKGRSMVHMEPQLAGVQVVNTLARGAGCMAQAELAAGPAAADGVGSLRLQVSGTAAPDCGVQRIAFMPLSHAEFTTRAVAALWRHSGGRLSGRVTDRPSTGESAVLQRDAAGAFELPFATHGSEMLPVVLRELNKHSNNLVARNLMLSLSPGFPLRSATLDGARTRVQQWLGTQGLAADDIEIDTGSGLSRAERGKPRAMVELLVRAWRSPTAKLFVDSLPVAGVDGTLANRMQTGAAAGQAQLKTGSLLDARTLAGYVKARSGKVYAVALMINHADAVRGTAALDLLIEWLAQNG
jgi:D-alanyl-D-alanine carboxypeptidase/D-alanyl-D-alanine-endopeptidase (penicillin-binding protein 4)